MAIKFSNFRKSSLKQRPILATSLVLLVLSFSQIVRANTPENLTQKWQQEKTRISIRQKLLYRFYLDHFEVRRELTRDLDAIDTADLIRGAQLLTSALVTGGGAIYIGGEAYLVGTIPSFVFLGAGGNAAAGALGSHTPIKENEPYFIQENPSLCRGEISEECLNLFSAAFEKIQADYEKAETEVSHSISQQITAIGDPGNGYFVSTDKLNRTIQLQLYRVEAIAKLNLLESVELEKLLEKMY